MSTDYKTAKEAFVSGMTGSTVMHINAISFNALAAVALHSALSSRLPLNKATNLPAAWFILVFPLLLSMTIFADNPVILSLLLLFPTGLLLLIPARESGTPLPSNEVPPKTTSPSSPRATASPSTLTASSRITSLPALTTYRAHMLLMTILAILAVDFPIFPRFLAKCESYGVSLMDIGVGSFVFSQGVVSSIPLLKDPSYLNAPLRPKLISVIRKTLPIIFLGLVRVLLVKGTEYPEHVSEYGTHWNFFITLAVVPVLQVALHPVISHVPISLVGIVVALSQQIALTFFGMGHFVLNAPRTNIISSNKEGIVSLTGYLAIHLLGLSTGTLILPPSPSFFRRRQQGQSRASPRRRNSDAMAATGNGDGLLSAHRQNDKTAAELCSYSVVWWSFLGLSQFIGIGSGVSRRMVNLPYIFWVAAYNTSFILGYLLLDLIFFSSPLSKSLYSSTSGLKIPADSSKLAVHSSMRQSQVGSPPALLEAINKNGLALFLVANVATGAINLTVPTMYTSDWTAMALLSAYAFGICAIAWAFRGRRLLQL